MLSGRVDLDLLDLLHLHLGRWLDDLNDWLFLLLLLSDACVVVDTGHWLLNCLSCCDDVSCRFLNRLFTTLVNMLLDEEAKFDQASNG